MIAARILGPQQVIVEQIPQIRPGPGEVLVRVLRVGICGSDLPLYAGEAREYPLGWGEPGHEVVGVVAADAAGWRQGQMVLAVTTAGLAEYVCVSPDNLLELSFNRPPEHLLLCQPLGTVLRALRRADSVVGKRAIVVGAGPIGLLFVAALKMLGAHWVAAVDPLADRIDRAMAMGADEGFVGTASQAVEGGLAGADVVVEAVGLPDTLSTAPLLAGHEGQVIMFGVPRSLGADGMVGMDLRRMLARAVELIFAHGPELHRDIAAARDLIAAGRIDVGPVVSHTLPFSQVKRAFEMAWRHEEGTAKIVLAVE